MKYMYFAGYLVYTSTIDVSYLSRWIASKKKSYIEQVTQNGSMQHYNNSVIIKSKGNPLKLLEA